jgi:hypothetical protein
VVSRRPYTISTQFSAALVRVLRDVRPYAFDTTTIGPFGGATDALTQAEKVAPGPRPHHARNVLLRGRGPRCAQPINFTSPDHPRSKHGLVSRFQRDSWVRMSPIMTPPTRGPLCRWRLPLGTDVAIPLAAARQGRGEFPLRGRPVSRASKGTDRTLPRWLAVRRYRMYDRSAQ